MDAKLLGLKIVKNIAKTQTGEFKGGVIYFINEPHGVKLGDDAPTVVLGRTANSQCVYRIDDLASHNSHVPQWDAGVDGKDEAAMKTYIERITSDIEAKAAAYEYADPQQGVNLADADEVSEATSSGWSAAQATYTKVELVNFCKGNSIEVKASWSKSKIIDAINAWVAKEELTDSKIAEEWNTKNG
jgi:hypothetical protein